MFRIKPGFTLIELLVVITLIGIFITLAIPSWDKVSQKRRVTNVTEQAAAFLAVAQGEAQKRNQPVSLAFSRTGDQTWCVGAAVGLDGCDCRETNADSTQYCALDGAQSSVQAADFQFVNLIQAIDSQPGGGDARITFDPIRGILQPAGDRLQFTFESTDGDFQLRVKLGPTGLLSICNPDADTMVAGYKTCSA